MSSLTGVQIGHAPEPYRLDYRLDASAAWATSTLEATATGDGWTRRLRLGHDGRGAWSVDATAAGVRSAALADQPGGDPAALIGALDCDVGFSPLTNLLPVRRLALLDDEPGAAHDVLTAWVAVPALSVEPSLQRYALVRGDAARPRVRFSAGDFSADLELDADGLVLDYPDLARRA